MISNVNPGFLFSFHQPVCYSPETLKQQIKKELGKVNIINVSIGQNASLYK